MLPKENRLNLEKDFQWATSGKKIDSQFARLFLKMGDNTLPRVGIALSGQVFKKATDRNRAKRLISAAFASLFSSLPAGINIVALPKVGVIKVKSAAVLFDLKSILKNEKIIT